MKSKDKRHRHHQEAGEKDALSQQELIAGTNTFSLGVPPQVALESPEGKNNGAEPLAFKNQQKGQT